MPVGSLFGLGLSVPDRTAPTLSSRHGPARDAPNLVADAAGARAEGTSADGAADCHTSPLVERWFSARPSLIVWDFDLTVLNTHAFGEGVEVADVADRYEADVRDIELFRSFVGTARTRSIPVGIASYGRREVILEYMKHIFSGPHALDGPPPFDARNVVTPSALQLLDGTSVPNGKPRMLSLLCDRLIPQMTVDEARVLFFDDDDANVDDCRRAGFTNAFHTPDGFSAEALARIETEYGPTPVSRQSSCAIS